MERTLLRNFPNGILILVDHDLRYVVVDGTELTRTGRVASQMEGKTIAELYPPEVVAHIEPYHRRLLAGESVSYEATLNGKTYFVQGEPVIEDGQVVAGVFSTQETTELRTKLGEVSEQQRTLLEHLPETVIAVLDTELRYVQVSRSMELLGWRSEELIGRPIAELLVDRPGTVATFEAALAGEPQSLDYRGIKDDRDYWLQIVPLRRNDQTFGVMVIAQDVTERKRLEAELADERRAKSLAVLAGGVAHDFNNLLQGILGHTALALAELPPDSPARPRLESAQSASWRAAELAGKMLSYSGAHGLELASVDLSDLVRAAYERVPPALSSRQAVHWRLAAVPTIARGDAAQLAQIPLNLIENALEANGAPTLSTGVDGERVYLEVADDGEGMDAATRASMFEPFFTTRFAGRGLGLSGVEGIVRGHGGEIRVETAPGRGTSVRVLLPAA